jgi:hypothetical protein
MSFYKLRSIGNFEVTNSVFSFLSSYFFRVENGDRAISDDLNVLELQIQIPMITAKFSSWFYELPREVGVLSVD